MVAKSRPLLPLGKPFHSYAVDAHLLDACRAPLQAYAARREDDRVVRLYCQELIDASLDSAERFWRTIEQLKQIEHERIPTVLDGGLDEDLAWIAVPAIEGASLWEIVMGGAPLDPMHLVMMLRDAVAALRVARDVGMLHGRLTPRQLLASAGECRGVLEVGFDRLFGPSAEGHDIVFRAPEQLDPLGEVDERADIYALGAVGYFALGAAPFEDATGAYDPAKLRRQILVEELPPLAGIRPDCPPAVENLLRAMCAKLPDHRPRTLEDLDEMLKSVLAVLVGRRKGQEPEGVTTPRDDVRALFVAAPFSGPHALDPEVKSNDPEIRNTQARDHRSTAPLPEPAERNDTRPLPTPSIWAGCRAELRIIGVAVGALGSVAVLAAIGFVLFISRIESQANSEATLPVPTHSSSQLPVAPAPTQPDPAPPPPPPSIEVTAARPARKPLRAPAPKPTSEPASPPVSVIQERVKSTRYPLKDLY